MMWPLTYHNSRHIVIETTLHPALRIYRKPNLQIFTKLTNCGGNWITGNVARVWRMWRVTALILRMFGVQEHDTYRTVRSVVCCGITGNVARVWRIWRVTALILRMFGVQEHATYRTVQSVFCCGIFHLQNTFHCTCIRYNLVLYTMFFSLVFWVSHLINQNTATTFCKIRKYFLFCKTFKRAPAKCAHWIIYQLQSQCCPLLPSIPTLFLYWYYFRVHLH